MPTNTQTSEPQASPLLIDMTRIEALQTDLDAHLQKVSPRQRRYIDARVEGNSLAKSAVMAGYAESTARKGQTRIQQQVGIAKSLSLLSQLNQLKQGISKSWLRLKAIDLLNVVTDTDSKHFNPGTAVKIMHEIALIDGSHAPKETHHSHTGAVSISMGIDRAPARVIEAK